MAKAKKASLVVKHYREKRDDDIENIIRLPWMPYGYVKSPGTRDNTQRLSRATSSCVVNPATSSSLYRMHPSTTAEQYGCIDGR